MADSTLNRYVSRGTNAQRVAYTPSPPTPASGPSPGYFFYETDTGNTYTWDGAAWDQVNTAGAVPDPIVPADGTQNITGNLVASGTVGGSNLSGTNTGDQTSIAGISGTKAQFDTACSDGNFLYVGDVTQYTDEMAQDAVGAMVDASLTYVDATPLLQRAALTGDVTAAAGSNATSIAANAVTTAKILDDNVTLAKIANAGANSVLVGSGATGSGANYVEITLGTNLSMSGTTLNATGGGGSTPTGTGFVHVTAGVQDGAAKLVDTADVNDDQITYAKIQNISVTDRILGRDTAAAGDIEELTVTGGLEFTGGPGIQRSALTGDITASAGSNATTLATNIVSNAKFRQSAGISVVGRSANTTGDVADITAVTDGHVLRLSGTTLGFGTVATAGIADDAVTFAKIQNIAANSVPARAAGTSGDLSEVALAASELLGRGSTGNVAAIVLGTNLSMSGTTLNATGGGSVAWGAITGTLSNQTDLQAALDLKAPLASPTFTGTVTIPLNLELTGSGYVRMNGDNFKRIISHANGVVGFGYNATPAVGSNYEHTIFDAGSLIKCGLDAIQFYSEAAAAVGTDYGSPGMTFTSTALTTLVPILAPACTTSITSIRLPHGTAPSSPTNGDVWTTTAGIFVRINGATVGPLSAGGGSVPTGTGFRHVTAGAEDAAAKLVDTADINDDQVTYAKIQNVSATDRLLGRDTAAAGNIEELTVGGGIEFTGSTGIQTSAFTGDVTKSAGGTATTIANDVVTGAKLAANPKIRTVVFIIDGGGSAITTGIKGDLEIPFAGTITGWTMLADQSGSIVVDIWKDTYANYPPTVADTITASDKPTISATTKGQDLAPTGWTTSITAGDTLRFNVDSASTVTRVTLTIRVNVT